LNITHALTQNHSESVVSRIATVVGGGAVTVDVRLELKGSKVLVADHPFPIASLIG
jgi:hypothetical protein